MSNDLIFNNLCENRILFNKFYASCDLFEDTENAIDYYKKSDFTEKCLGEKYILLYGLFEAFFIQYEAAKKLEEVIVNLINNKQTALDLTEDFNKLDEIKKHRHDIAGHPAYREGKNTGYSVYLSQYNLSKEKIEYQKSRTHELITIDVMQEICTQETSLLNILNKVFEKLKLEEEEHYKKYKDEKLYDFFNKDYRYPREKINDNNFYKESLNWLKKLSDDIKQKLNERYVNYKKLHYSNLINDIDYIIDFLENKLDDFHINLKYKNFIKNNMVENLTSKFDDLMKIFEEIDKKYENYFNPQEEKESAMLSITIVDDISEDREVINVK